MTRRLFIFAAVICIAGLSFIFRNGFFSSSCCGKELPLEKVVELKRAAAAGSVQAIWSLYEDSSNRGATEESLNYLASLSIDHHDNEARFQYFFTACNDRAVFEKHQVLAKKLFIDAASNGHVVAAFFLARFHESGECGFLENRDEAAKWYLVAANGGNELALTKYRELTSK
jgi:TPR repeat protein